MAARTDLIIDQGASFSHTFSANTDFDVTGYTGKSLLKKDFQANTSTTFGVVVANTGEVTITLTANQTVVLSPGRYVYDVELESSNNTVRWAEGTAMVTPGVSL